MKNKSFLIVANWKMQLSFKQTLQFCTNYHKQFISISNLPHKKIVLCPSFTALYPITQLFSNTALAIGAQDCSRYKMGAYTGQVSALSLAQLGCSYCIIGHSERRMYCHESDQEIAEKAVRLLEQNIQPLICIGESKHEYEQQQTKAVLERQLEPLIPVIQHITHAHDILVAYEPIWAIGTGTIPSTEYLTTTFTWLEQYLKKRLPLHTAILLYGGSVNEQTITHIANIQKISGLLIGGASLNFKKFNNLISLL